MSFEPIDDALDIETSIVKKEEEGEITPTESKEKPTTPQAEADYNYSRGQLYSLIEKGQEAVNNALELANEGSSARSYEVVGGLIKNVADVTDKLLDLQKKVKELDEVSITNNQTNVTNNSVFVGSTTELQKMLKEGLLNND